MKQKFKIKESFVGKPEDAERLIEVARKLLNLEEERPKEKDKAA